MLRNTAWSSCGQIYGSYNLRNGAPVYWNKIPILQEAFTRFPETEWVWWMDIDIIIMNMSLNIYNHVLSKEGLARILDRPMTGASGAEAGYRTPAGYRYDDINFIISMDAWGMNVGKFLMRRGDWSKWLLDLWIDPLFISQNWGFPEQDAWIHMW